MVKDGLPFVLLFAAVLLTGCLQRSPTPAQGMERIAISSDGRGFILMPSGRTFHPWGNNYGHKGMLMEDFWAANWAAIDGDFHEMKRMGANVVRVHLQFGKFMLTAERPNAQSLRRLRRLLKLAEDTGLYLDLTGLACYRPSDVPPWYDKLPEAQRWRAQARFWGAISKTCANSPAVFCYDLVNEPVITTDKQKPGHWYTGELGGLNFLQFIDLDPAGRSFETIAAQWGDEMKAAIRAGDQAHFITVGLLPFSPGPEILKSLDFVCVHIYPEKGKVDEAMRTLKSFDAGKPIVIEETFPLACSKDELRTFLLDSRQYACGWIGHYNGESRAELEGLRRTGKITIQQTLWLAWLELFQELGPVMAGANHGSPPN